MRYADLLAGDVLYSDDATDNNLWLVTSTSFEHAIGLTLVQLICLDEIDQSPVLMRLEHVVPQAFNVLRGNTLMQFGRAS